MKYDKFCSLCNTEFSSSRALSYHLRMTHSMSRREYVVLSEYAGVAPKCATCGENDAAFEFSRFGTFCSAKCRADSAEHILKSTLTIVAAQKDNSDFKKANGGLTRCELALFSHPDFKRLGFEKQRIINLNPENLFSREIDAWVVADFLHADLMLIIEIDGDGHDVEKDAARDRRLFDLGYSVVRVSNSQIEEYLDSFVQLVEDIVRHSGEIRRAAINRLERTEGMGSSTIGGSGVGFGISIGSTWTDTACVDRLNAREMAAFGDKDAAKELLCNDSKIAAAYAAAGRPCKSVVVQPQPARIAAVSSTTANPSCYNDEIVASRTGKPVCK